MPVPVLWLAAALLAYPSVPPMAVPTVEPLRASAGRTLHTRAFGESLRDCRVLWSAAGTLTLAHAPEQRTPAGAPSARCQAPEGTRAGAGWQFDLGPERWWQVRVTAAARVASGRARIVLQWLGERGDVLAWQALGTLRPDGEWGVLADLVPVPTAARRVNVLLLCEGTLTAWLGELTVSTPTVSAEEARLLAPATTTYGTVGWPRGGDAYVRDTAAKLLVCAGLTHTRLWADWRTLEPAPGRFEFASFDAQLAELERYGVTADLVCLTGVPTWASGRDETAPGFGPPRDWELLARFVDALVARAKNRVRAWQVLDQPDLADGSFRGGYDDYRQFLRTVHRAARLADPGCRVVTGAMAGDAWLPALLRDGRAGDWEAVGLAPFDDSPAAVVGRVRRVQQLLLAYGAPRPVLVSSVGYQCGGWPEGPAKRANELEKAASGRATLAGLGALCPLVLWYTAVDKLSRFGLLRDDGSVLTPMPAYWELGRLTGALVDDGAPVAASVRVDGRTVTLTGTNTTGATQRVRLWPVGFLRRMGLERAQLREAEWAGELAPGDSHSVTLVLDPQPGAEEGPYPVGVAVLGASGNALATANLTLR